MPSRHRRIGLVVDEDIDLALGVVREGSTKASLPDATAVRDAVLEGAVLSAVFSVARRPSTEVGAQAAALLAELRDLLPALELPTSVTEIVGQNVDATRARQISAERRQKQLMLLSSPNPHGRAAQEYADYHDALDATGHMRRR